MAEKYYSCNDKGVKQTNFKRIFISDGSSSRKYFYGYIKRTQAIRNKTKF